MDYFSLDSLSGDLSVAKQIDRESLSNNNGIITLIVRVSVLISKLYMTCYFFVFNF